MPGQKLLCLLLTLQVGVLFCQPIPEKLYFSHLDNKISDTVDDIFEDSRGYLWFCTTTGLFRYDGTNVKMYKANPRDTNSLSLSMVRWIQEDKQGKLWIGTWDKGLNAVDPLTEQFEHYYHNEKDSASISNDKPKYIAVDQEGLLWIGFDGVEGLNQFNPATGKAKRFAVKRGQKGALQGRVLGNIIADSNRIYLATTAGFEYYDKLSGQFHFFPLLDEQGDTLFYSLNAICKRKDGTIWMDMPGEGLRVYDPAADRFLPLNVRNSNGQRNPKLTHILEGKYGRLWLFNQVELWSLSADQKVLQKHEIAFLEENLRFNYQGIRRPYIDRFGMIWINNIYFDPRRLIFEFHDIISAKSKQPLEIGTIQEPNDSLLLLSTNEGYYWYNLNNRSGKPAFFSKPIPIGNSDFSPDRMNWAWLNVNNVYSVYNMDTEKLYGLSLEKNGNFYPTPLMGTAFDKDENLWLATWGNGLIRIKREVWKNATGPISNFTNWLPGDPNYPIPAKNLLNLMIDSRNDVWVAGNVGGLTRIDGKDESIQNYIPKLGTNSISASYVFNIAEDKEGDIWIATCGAGINKIDNKSGEITIYDRYNGLEHEDVFNIHIDQEGCIWVNGPAGITSYDPAKESFLHYDWSDGLLAWSFNGAISKKTGRMYWGGFKGFTLINPTVLKNRPTQASDIRITAIEALDPETQKLLPVNLGEWTDQTLEFDHQQNILNIRFAILDFRNVNRHHYQYAFTQGEAPAWIDLGRENQVRLNQLKPGSYYFHLKACNSDQIWTELKTPLKIIIHPPFWQTTWAYLLYTLLLGSGIYLLYRNSLTRQLAKNEAKQIKALERLRARFYTNITHEFRTPLTVILGMTETESDIPKAMKLIRRNGQKLLQLINQLLDLSKLDNNALKPNYQQIEMVAYSQYIGESFQSLAEKKQIELTVTSEIEQLWMDMDEEMYRQILSNLLTNAIKFTPENGKVSLSLEQTENQLVLEIQDNGIGIPYDDLPHIFDRFYQADNYESRQGNGTGIGLALVKELVNVLEGEIEVESNPDGLSGERGTLFEIHFPIRQSADKKGEGFTPMPIDRSLETPALIEPLLNNSALPNLLIIEDNPDVIIYIQTLLQDHYRIQIAANGAIGIENAIETIPDIIISDVMMPEKDGFEVVETLKQDERTSHIPIILLTARATQEDRIQGLKHGADAYLMKPFDKAELFIRLEKLLELRRALQARYANAVQPISGLEGKQSSLLPSIDDLFLKKIRQIIEKKIDDPDLNIPHLCQAAGMSDTQLFRKMKALTGNAPMTFIRKVRLHKARELLQNTDLTIAEIAYDVGFSDPNYFSRAFGKEFGRSPSAMRE